jgi:hypothetical protein
VSAQPQCQGVGDGHLVGEALGNVSARADRSLTAIRALDHHYRRQAERLPDLLQQRGQSTFTRENRPGQRGQHRRLGAGPGRVGGPPS